MRLKIRNASLAGGHAYVEVDGVQQLDITRLELSMDATGSTLATITRVVQVDLDIDVETQIRFPSRRS